MLPDHTAIVFSGGGTRGIAFAGCLEALREQGIDWGLRCPPLETAAGCSIGALMALLICLGFSAHEICQLVLNTEFHDLVVLDPMHILQVLTTGALGLDPGNVLREWIAKQISRKTTLDHGAAKRMTFSQLKQKTGINFVCVATNLSTRTLRVFSAEASPEICVVDAVQASMALPPLFQPVPIDGTLFTDGGLINNFPVDLFQPSKVFGLRLASEPQTIQEIQQMKLPLLGFVNFLLKLASFPADAAAWYVIDASIRESRIVNIPCGKVSTFESDVSTVKTFLFETGKSAMNDFLKTKCIQGVEDWKATIRPDIFKQISE